VLPLPSGAQATPYAYDVTAFFVSAQTAQPEACYRLIRTLAQRPALFGGMPAYASLIDAAETAAARPPALVDFYRRYAEIINQPDTVRLRTLQQRQEPLVFVADRLLARAFDRYVREDADLDAELAEAQRLSETVITCLNDAAPTDASTEEQIFTCAQHVGDIQRRREQCRRRDYSLELFDIALHLFVAVLELASAR
jgi:hypothetical protein